MTEIFDKTPFDRMRYFRGFEKLFSKGTASISIQLFEQIIKSKEAKTGGNGNANL
ncbi:MAG: hypothetical protein WAU15_11640 [Nitrosomonas sp.]